MDFLLWAIIAFLFGSLPFSVWVGRFVLRKNIRDYGDYNPGATNVLRAGGRGSAAVALALDFLKGTIPVGLVFLTTDIGGMWLAIVALMPVLGHAFSPFLRFRGGKAIAVSGGVWCGLTGWIGPTFGGLALGLTVYLLGPNGWSVIIGMLGLLLALLLAPASWYGQYPQPELSTILALWCGNMLVLVWKHRADLTKPPTLRRRTRSDS